MRPVPSQSRVADKHRARIVGESLALDRLDVHDDEEVIARLTAARGLGPWTAQMFLIHEMRRPDVFPAGDLGIRHALHRAFHRTERPRVTDAAEIGRPWSPYRTYAAALLWASLASRRPVGYLHSLAQC